MVRREQTRSRRAHARVAAHLTACIALTITLVIAPRLAPPAIAASLPAPPTRLASLMITTPDAGSASALRFAGALAAQGDLVAIGAPVGGDWTDDEARMPGEVIVARIAHGRVWSHMVESVIRSPSGEGDGFGTSLAIAADPTGAPACLLAGGPDANGCGTVYAWVRSAAPHPDWELRRELASPHGQPGSEFGGVIAVGGPASTPVVAVAARRFDPDGGVFDAGAVHLFALDESTAEGEAGPAKPRQDLVSPSPEMSGWFGSAIAIGERWLAISAPGERVGALAGAGAVHLYGLDGGGAARFRTTIHSPRAATHAWFGAALAMDGDRLVVGEPLAAVAGVRCGRAWCFELGDDPSTPIVLEPPLLQPGLGFGQWLAAEGGCTVVCAPGFDGAAEDTGIAWSFDHDGGVAESFEGPSRHATALFGWQVVRASSAAGRGAILFGHLYVDEESIAPSAGCALFDLTPTAGTTVQASAASPPPPRRR